MAKRAEQAPADLLPLLKKAELFSALLDDDLEFVAGRVEPVRLAAGARVFAAGESAERFFILRSGEVGIYRREEGAAGAAAGGLAERRIASFVAGDVLGDFAFAAGSRYDAEARAESEVELLAFPRAGEGVGDLARERPGAVSRMLLRSLSMISSRLRSTQRLISENSPWVRELRRQIYTDPGTGLYTRAFLDEEVARSLAKPTSIVMVKPDRFKEFVDEHGHAAGDEAMVQVATVLSAEVERTGRGWAIRLRSNETAIVVPSCDDSEAADLARRVARRVSGIRVGASGRAGFTFTCSMALAQWPTDGEDWKALVEDSCAALTRAWSDGGARLYTLRSIVGEAP
jgi:diguanylate cyclase (GGDEF)-like protein